MYKKVKATPINAPTRFASNFFVAKGISDTSQALIQLVGTEEWKVGPGKTNSGEHIRKIILRELPGHEYFREDLLRLLELLQPFSDAIRQLECDRPMLAQCHITLSTLAEHIKAFVEKYKDQRDGLLVLRLQETFQRRYDTSSNSVRAPIYNAAYTAAYLTDPYYAQLQGTTWHMPPVPMDQMEAAVALVRRVGGPAAATALTSTILGGYPQKMQMWVEAAATAPMLVKSSTSSNKRQCQAMPSVEVRQNVWGKLGEDLPDLRDVVLRLMSCHATSCATERNWSLWGRVFTAARNGLGAERAKKLITICTNSRTHSVESDFAVTLKVVEGELQ